MYGSSDKKKMMMGSQAKKEKNMMNPRMGKMVGGAVSKGTQPTYGGDIASAMPRATPN
tara:strand:- start:4952 stop:5125 length:174 start_codon:yes stop_codon:yes gene_type:complete